MIKIPKSLQRGAALITALFVVAIAATLATALAVNQRLLINQTSLMFGADTLYLDLQGVEDWGLQQVDALLDKNGHAVAHLKNPNFTPVTLNGVHISGYLVDAEGKFNLNSLQDSTNQAYFVRLLSKLQMQAPASLPQNISNWVGKTTSSQDEQYLKLKPPYRPPHRFMANRSELRAIFGVSAALYRQLAPYVVALPTASYSVNVNSAPAALIESVSPKLTDAQVDSIISCRTTTGGISSAVQLQSCAGDVSKDALSGLIYYTDYYMLFAHASSGSQQLNLQALLGIVQPSNGGVASFKVLWQQVY